MANYFTSIPTVSYDMSGKSPNQYKTVTNIMRRLKFKTGMTDNLALYYPYFIREGERPDIVSNNAYGTVQYAYLILLFNEIQDPLFDWPLSSQQFESYIISKYGGVDTAQLTVHAYYQIIRAEVSATQIADRIPAVKYVVDSLTYADLNSTEREVQYAYDYEVELNDAKREIKLINPSYIEQVDFEVKKTFKI